MKIKVMTRKGISLLSALCITIPAGSYSLDSSLFTTTKHTNADVRTFALGYGAEYFHGKTVDNTDIGNFLINAIAN